MTDIDVGRPGHRVDTEPDRHRTQRRTADCAVTVRLHGLPHLIGQTWRQRLVEDSVVDERHPPGHDRAPRTVEIVGMSCAPAGNAEESKENMGIEGLSGASNQHARAQRGTR
ncbi:hypothetical protein [Rhodococcoides kroppenstedtii]|uniref:hypothetical protein n=1 Tax=Rhodococcoides kroppenstedtii TaxID=293050 RepID=UPI0012FF649B|nr:hypothetical protein [Rhodococcus kroppenstedtii]MBY6313376.1 hypothetical protein [Rhodococcus kroppenstedtii]MBY6400316.1 hypothetical protein [Rhodococcus kroppenstedtii]